MHLCSRICHTQHVLQPRSTGELHFLPGENFIFQNFGRRYILLEGNKCHIDEIMELSPMVWRLLIFERALCGHRHSHLLTPQVLIKHMAQSCPSVKHLYIDFGCRMESAWTWYKQVRKFVCIFKECNHGCTVVPRAVLIIPWLHSGMMQVLGEELPSTAHSIKLMVNWMHGASHDMACQLRNNGRFQAGAAWVVGEQIEQLWSMLRVCAFSCCFACLIDWI